MYNFQHFRIKPGSKVKLGTIDPGFTAHYKSKSTALAETKRNLKKLTGLQELLYAEHRRSLLICLQAIDAGGKDGTIRHVISAMNPQGLPRRGV